MTLACQRLQVMTMTTNFNKQNAQSQMDRFKEAARALECDQDEAPFDEKLKGIAKQKTSSSAATTDK